MIIRLLILWINVISLLGCMATIPTEKDAVPLTTIYHQVAKTTDENSVSLSLKQIIPSSPCVPLTVLGHWRSVSAVESLWIPSYTTHFRLFPILPR